MTVASIISGVLKAFSTFGAIIEAIMASIQSRRDEELGKLKERERNAQSDQDLRDIVNRADPSSLSDDEAFGPAPSAGGVPGDPVQGSGKG